MEKTKDKVIFDGDFNLKNCGHYKKDNPHKNIGLQKWRYTKRFIVDASFIVVAKHKLRADHLVENVADIKNIDFKDECEVHDLKIDIGSEECQIETRNDHFLDETIKRYTVQEIPIGGAGGSLKIEECIPYVDTFYADEEDNRKEHDRKEYDNYEDPNWKKDEYDWRLKEDGKPIKNEDK